MLSSKSPGGSMFPYYYKGGEIHCLKYGSFYKDYNALNKIMQEEEAFIESKNQKLRIWVDFYKTSHTGDILDMFLENLKSIEDHIFKLGIVGFSFIDKLKFKRLSKSKGYNFKIPVRFYDDPEEAKTWLVE